jgi:hypothetical protein
MPPWLDWEAPELVPDPVDVPLVPLDVPDDCANAAVARQSEIAVAVSILHFI